MTLLYVIETVPWTNETNSKNRVEYPNVCPNTESDVIHTPTKTSYVHHDVNRLANVWLHNSEKKTHTNIAGSCQNETNLSSFRNRVKIFLDFSHFPVIFTTKPILY